MNILRTLLRRGI